MIAPMSAASKIIILYLISNLGKLTASLDGSLMSIDANNNEIDDINSYDLNEPVGKRTYTYVSEFKRLPVYNFGLGKRQAYGDKRIRPYSFGIGKRSRGFRFGLGKKSDSLMNLDYPQLNSYDSYYHPDMSRAYEEKRNNKMYSFGLGKRLPESVSSLAENLLANPKRANDERKFSFGLGKRGLEDEEILMS